MNLHKILIFSKLIFLKSCSKVDVNTKRFKSAAIFHVIINSFFYT
jgi:hypothetical protein